MVAPGTRPSRIAIEVGVKPLLAVFVLLRLSQTCMGAYPTEAYTACLSYLFSTSGAHAREAVLLFVSLLVPRVGPFLPPSLPDGRD